MRISRLIDRGILVTDNDLVRNKTYTDAHNFTTAQTHTRTGVCGLCRCVQLVQLVQSVQCLLIIPNYSFLIIFTIFAQVFSSKGNAF